MAKRCHRRCPHCKSDSGFIVTVQLGGHGESVVTFKGDVLKHKRCGTDTTEKWAECLDCKKLISVDKLDINNV